METFGIFEAKTKFTSLCERVERTRHAVIVSKRGRPMVMLTPVPPALQSERADILTAWNDWQAGAEEPEFPDVVKLRGSTKRSPLAE